MLHYLLQTVAFQVFFLIIYDVFLRNETFFNLNRVYLMGTGLLSFILPFLKFDSIKAIVPEPMVIRLPEVIIGKVSTEFSAENIMIQPDQMTEHALGFSWNYVWIMGMVLAALILVFKIIKIARMLYKNPKQWRGEALIVLLMNSSAAFSFFHYIFLGSTIEADKKEHIVQHEMVHVREKHSIDLLVFELLRIVFWFNPLIYIYQNRLSTLHEFIADAKAVKYKGKSEYYQNLLSQVFETQQISFINPFYHQSLIKKRILMLSKSKSKQIHLFKYALLVPMVMAMLMYTSSYASEVKDPFPIMQNETLNQELTFKELVDKYYKEVVELGKTKDNFQALHKGYFNAEKNYIGSKDEVAKGQAYIQFLVKKFRSKKKDDVFADVNEDMFNKMSNRFETYKDYLEYKKTDKGKMDWENKARDGELRLVVDDMKNLTEAEQKRKAEKIALIVKDGSYHKLKMTDGKMSMDLNMDKDDSTIIDNIKIKDISSDAYNIEVPFAVIDEVPLFEGCEPSGSQEADKMCTSKNISMFVNNHFNVDLATELGLTGKQRINVIFKIGKDGKVREVMSRAPHPGLEAEAIRVIKSMPDFTPGKQKGKNVTVPYSLPILFQVQDDAPKSDTKDTESEEKAYLKELETKEQNKIMSEVPYAVVDEVPLFPSCETMDSNASRKQCTSDKIIFFVNKNFNTKLAKKLGLSGTQRLMVIFKIGEDGYISDIKARASHPGLEKEAIRVIEALPKMTPGKQKGKVVTVPYSIPIVFKVQ